MLIKLTPFARGLSLLKEQSLKRGEKLRYAGTLVVGRKFAISADLLFRANKSNGP